jgi:hypothetical protein
MRAACNAAHNGGEAANKANALVNRDQAAAESAARPGGGAANNKKRARLKT